MSQPRNNGPMLSISADTFIPDLLRSHPEARPALDLHGLHGCGGPTGPHETLGFFAQAHGVELSRLMQDVRRAIAHPAAQFVTQPTHFADRLYQRFFTAGILVTLTAGATWGAWLLWSVAVSGSFRSPSLQSVNAHGEAQIFGWVGLFIMGFAYQAFPRIWHSRLAWPHAAIWTFLLMLVGLVTRTVGMTTAADWSLGKPMAMFGGVCEIVAVSIFVAQMIKTWSAGDVPLEPYVAFVLGSLVWFWGSSVVSVWHTWTTLSARSTEALIWYVATYQLVLRDLQIHGFALFMILGVSLRMMPPLFGVPAIKPKRAWLAYAILTAAVFGEVVLFLAYRWMKNPALAVSLIVPWLMLAIGVGLIVIPWSPWRRFPRQDRSAKFVRAAYGWLALSLIMLLAMPAYQAAHGTFSHAYGGAVRHAITVGFVSLMIVGISSKVVPTLKGIDMTSLTSLWGPFLLINLGCLLRVTIQIVTDWHKPIYPFLGISGTLEVAGLTWWGLGLIRLMWRRVPTSAVSDVKSSQRPLRIEATHHVADVLDWYPQLERVLVAKGFSLLNQPLLRNTVARQVTLEQAAAMRNIDISTLLESLNAALAPTQLVTIQPYKPAARPAAAVTPDPRLAQSVAQLVAERPERAERFESFGIDQCCGGHHTLAEACKLRGLNPADVLAAIDAAPTKTKGAAAPNWESMPIATLIDEIEGSHHSHLKREVPKLANLVEKVKAAHGARHPELETLADVFHALQEDLLSHIDLEEQRLFPEIRELLRGRGQDKSSDHRVHDPLSLVEFQHEESMAAFSRMRGLTNDYTPPDDACASYRGLMRGLADLESDLGEHIFLEHEILFPRLASLASEQTSQQAK